MPKRIISRLVRGLQWSVAMMVFTHGAMTGWIKKFLMRKLSSSPNLKGGFAALELHWLQGLAVLRKVYLTRLADMRASDSTPDPVTAVKTALHPQTMLSLLVLSKYAGTKTPTRQ